MRRGALYIITAPPSENNLYYHAPTKLKNGKWGTRRFRTKEYKEWIETAGIEMLIHHRGQTPEALGRGNKPCCDYFCGFGFDRDVGNAEKPISDLLKRCGILQDDRYIHRVSCERAEEGLEVPGFGNIKPEKGKVLVCVTWQPTNGQ